MVFYIIGIIVGLGLIIAGFSGEYVWKGTDSSLALIVIGAIFLIYDLIQIARHKKK